MKKKRKEIKLMFLVLLQVPISKCIYLINNDSDMNEKSFN